MWIFRRDSKADQDDLPTKREDATHATYKPRSITFTGVETRAGYRLKTYAITHDFTTLDAHAFDGGLNLACGELPSPAQTDARPGLGFVVMHHTVAIDYIILAWWDRQNELPTRVFVREAGKDWRPANGALQKSPASRRKHENHATPQRPIATRPSRHYPSGREPP